MWAVDDSNQIIWTYSLFICAEYWLFKILNIYHSFFVLFLLKKGKKNKNNNKNKVRSGLSVQFSWVCMHWDSQRWRLDVADISVQVWALWIYTPETSSGVDTGGATAAVMHLCKTLVHIWSGTGMCGGRREKERENQGEEFCMRKEEEEGSCGKEQV